MADYIPMVTSQQSWELVKTIYPDSQMVRISLDMISRFGTLSNDVTLWLDPAIDGLHDLPSRQKKKTAWYEAMKHFSGFAQISTPAFIAKPDSKQVKVFISELLDKCMEFRPAWITVPQLPLVDGAERNKINRALARATGEWRSSHSFSGRFVLPLIFTNQRQINGKTERNPKVDQARRCYEDSHADGFWVVDASLTDDSGSPTLRNRRFPGLIALHQELNLSIPSKVRIAGPYWGMNLVLWARGLVDFPVIGVGTNYQYHIVGGVASTPNIRLAIGSLRRRVISAPQFGPWLDKAMGVVASPNPAYIELELMRRRLPFLNVTYQTQVATSYKNWFARIESSPKPGRALALFQDLSTAYALGKTLPLMPWEKAARRPEAVAEPLMMSCL